MISLKSILAKLFAKHVRNQVFKWANNPIETQQKVFQTLIKEASITEFGNDHDFKNLKTTKSYKFLNLN